jgi:hypothetical protein
VVAVRLLLRRGGSIMALRRSRRCAVVLWRRLLLVATVRLLRWRRSAMRVMALGLLISALLGRVLPRRRLLITAIWLLLRGILTIALGRRRF